MLKRMLLLLTLAVTGQVHAIDYTDLWWDPAESGWGVNLVQNGDFIFATFFVYGADGRPTWVTSQLTLNADGHFDGPMFATDGPYYAAPPFDPGQVVRVQVGSVNFRPGSAEFGVLFYSVGDDFVNKNIRRQTLAPIVIAGSYLGGMITSVSECIDPAQNRAASSFAEISVIQYHTGHMRLDVSSQGAAACTLQGTLSQIGRLQRVVDASYTCDTGLEANATVYELKATAQGIEGRWAASIGEGCRENVHFSAALR